MALVLKTNVKFDGQILSKGSTVSKDHAAYNVVEKYLVDEKDLGETSVVKTARVITSQPAKEIDEDDNVPAVTMRVKDIKEAVVINNDPANLPDETNTDPKNDENAPVEMTKAIIMEKLTEKGIEFDKRANKADLLALLETV